MWQLAILLIVFVLVSAFLLRQNNLEMIKKRNLVLQADEQNGDVEKALSELQKYVLSHMNTSLGQNGIYLEHTYQRAYDRAVQEGLKDDSASRNLYEQADQACQAVFNRTYSFPAYTQCVAERLTEESSNDPLSNVALPSVDIFRYNFVSPVWSPDFAGFSVLITGVIAVLLVFRAMSFVGLYLILNKHKY